MKPYTEVVIHNDIRNGDGRLYVGDNCLFKLKENSIQRMWYGSIENFKRRFEIPEDAPLSTKDTGFGDGDSANFVIDWNMTTLNFKFNYQVWFKDPSTTTYVLGSNNTINLTIPNVLVFNGNQSNNNTITYDNTGGSVSPRVYNPNIFRLPISINSFPVSNKLDNYQAVSGYGTDSEIYLIFRYGSGGNDIEICLMCKNSNAFQVNSASLIIPYATLTFTGFNKIKP